MSNTIQAGEIGLPHVVVSVPTHPAVLAAEAALPQVVVSVPTCPTVQAIEVELPRVVITAAAAAGGEAPVATAIALEPISGGDFVRFVAGGIRRADAALVAGAANGFVRKSVVQGGSALVFASGRLSFLSDPSGPAYYLAAGCAYYLAAGNPGKTTGTPQAAWISQYLGVAVDAQTLSVGLAPAIRTTGIFMQPS